uniref:(northern house mosquito) hypothetical protein n=1 Tax=Culex pipiens TaxID=7175 RepID=A0A8D8IKX7_CULPI
MKCPRRKVRESPMKIGSGCITMWLYVGDIWWMRKFCESLKTLAVAFCETRCVDCLSTGWRNSVRSTVMDRCTIMVKHIRASRTLIGRSVGKPCPRVSARFQTRRNRP